MSVVVTWRVGFIRIYRSRHRSRGPRSVNTAVGLAGSRMPTGAQVLDRVERLVPRPCSVEAKPDGHKEQAPGLVSVIMERHHFLVFNQRLGTIAITSTFGLSAILSAIKDLQRISLDIKLRVNCTARDGGRLATAVHA